MKKYLIALAAVASVGIAQGAIITSTAASFTVANDDLLQTSLGSVVADDMTTNNNGGDLSPGETALRDGVWNNNASSRGSALVENGEQASYNLDLVANPLGYNVDQIDLYSNWGTGDGRNEIRVNINYSLVATPTVFDQVLTVDATTLFTYQPVSTGDVDGTQGKMSLTDLGLTDVAGVQFIWPANQENGAVGYSELDVIGSAIPEPGTLGLVAAFGGGVLFIRRRFMI